MADIRFLTTSYEKCKYDFIAFKNANRATKQTETYFDWRYLNRPWNKLKPIIIWAESSEGKKIGSLSLVSHYYMINNRLSPVGVMGDISVEKNWRGKGIAKQMFDYLSGLEHVNNFEVCIVMPSEDAARPLEKAHWKPTTRLERYVKRIDFEKTLGSKFKSGRLSTVVARSLKKTADLLTLETYLKDAPDYTGELIAGFDERFDDLWNNVNRKEMIIGLRNKEYLTWRYSHHPVMRYHVFILTQREKLRGYIIFSIDKDQYHIDDILSLNGKNHYINLLNYFLKFARSNDGVSSITLKLNNNDLLSFPLSLFGFIRRYDHQKFLITDNNGMRDDAHSLLLDGRKWYLTHADKEV